MACGTWGIEEWSGTADAYWGGVQAGLPAIYGLYPQCDATNVLRTTHISFTAVDPCGVLDLTCTEISVTIGSGSAVIVYQTGAFQNGWTGTTTPVTTPSGASGYVFELIPPATFPAETTVCITISACSHAGLTTTLSCCFRTVALLTLTVELISQIRLLVRFSNPLRNIPANAAVTTRTNWSVRPIPGNAVHSARHTVEVRGLYPENRFNPTFVILDVSKMERNQRYEVAAQNFLDIYGQTFASGEDANEARRTKVDGILDGLPDMWEGTRTSNLYWLLSAIAQQDDKIGGDQGVLPGSTLRGLF